MFKLIKVKNQEEGFEVCKKLLYQQVTKNSVLFLSGGSTPKTLYENLAKEKILNPGAVALIDERFVQNHESRSMKHDLPGTNELMIRQAGLTEYLGKIKTRFYPILEEKDIQQTTHDYDETVRFLFNYFQKSIAILGIGADGHTAGIPARTQNSKLKTENKTDLVTSFDNFPGDYKERITLTFLAIYNFDQIFILVFGKDKRQALKQMFKDGPISNIPARFLNTNEISQKVTLITDQIIK